MKRTMICLYLVIIVMFGSRAFAELKKEKIDTTKVPQSLMQMAMQYVPVRTDNPFTKTPDNIQGTLKSGTLNIDGKRSFDFALYGEQNSPLTLIIDANQDKDLTNDKQFKDLKFGEAQDISVDVPGESSVSIRVVATPYYLMLQPSEWLTGSVIIGGKSYNIGIIDAGADGIAATDEMGPSRPDLLLVDLNENGTFEADISKMDMPEFAMLQSEITLGGKLYTAEVQADKLDIKLVPYSGEQGKLGIDMKFKTAFKDFSFFGYLTKGESMKMLSAGKKDFPISLSAGSYNMAMAVFSLTTQDGKQYMLQVKTEEPIKIQGSEITTLALGEYKPLKVNVSQTKNEMTVVKSLTSKEGVEYQVINAYPSEGLTDRFQPEGPNVKILGQDKSVLAEGKMQFG